MNCLDEDLRRSRLFVESERPNYCPIEIWMFACFLSTDYKKVYTSYLHRIEREPGADSGNRKPMKSICHARTAGVGHRLLTPYARTSTFCPRCDSVGPTGPLLRGFVGFVASRPDSLEDDAP